MLDRKYVVPFLSIGLALALCGVTVFAASSTGENPSGPGQESSIVQQDGQAVPEDAPVPETVYTAEAPAEEETGTAQAEIEEEEKEEPPAEIAPDPVGKLSFANLNSRMRANNFNLLSLEETISAIQVIDYDKMTEDIRKQLNQIAKIQWMLTISGNSSAADSLQQSYDALRDTFDDLKDGKIQEENDAVIRQLRNAQNQVVMAGEALYIALTELEMNDYSMHRSLTALDRTIQEMELRYDLGQISALTLQQTKASRVSLISGQQTLEMSIANYKTQLELMSGAEMSGTIQLQTLPQVSGKELEAMELETDLAAAKKASYELFATKRTLDDAKESFADAGEDNHYNDSKYQYVSAKHTWQAAQYTYNANIQNYENRFRTLYLQVKDYQQVLKAAKTALACEKSTYSSLQLKYEQGGISQNKLLDAADKVSAAQEKVDSANINLFSAYHNYRWAVDYGILN